MISTAWAADAHGGGGLFSDPTFWVAVAFFLFLAIAGKTLAKGLTKLLDDRTALIARTLGDNAKGRRHLAASRRFLLEQFAPDNTNTPPDTTH